VSAAREAFLRRYATSPIHVPRLERLLSLYDGEADGFAARFIEWDRSCPDVEAARIVAEILSAGDAAGRMVRLSDEAILTAIRWMSAPSSFSVAQRADCLRAALANPDAAEAEIAVSGLEADTA
jgi:hypothetical protein